LRLLTRIRDESLKYPEAAMFSACMTELLSHEPRTVYEAMMVTDLFMQLYEVGCENARSFGLIDRIYEPLFLADREAGRLDEEDLRELLRYLLNKYSAADRWAGQPFGLGGADKDGHYGSTYLTRIILEVYSELNIYNPKIHVRYHPSMPDDLLRQILTMIRDGKSSINLMSDEIVWRGYEKLGIPREVSQHYVPQGCFEPTLMGLEEPLICCSWISIPKAIEFTLNNGVDMLTGRVSGIQYATPPTTYEEFYRRFTVQLDTIINNVIRKRANAEPLAKLDDKTLCDEWCREFFQEGRRRSDLVRFGMFAGEQADKLSYTWEGRNGQSSAAGYKSMEEKFNWFPIPNDDKASNTNYKKTQGDGY
jgi:formate C-acetyltransferase